MPTVAPAHLVISLLAAVRGPRIGERELFGGLPDDVTGFIAWPDYESWCIIIEPTRGGVGLYRAFVLSDRYVGGEEAGGLAATRPNAEAVSSTLTPA